MWWLVALVACGTGTPDPALADQRQALVLWEQGKQALEHGDAVLALQHFAEARRQRPEDALLLAWEAQALAQKGDLQQAILRLDQALLLEPKLLEARYNRAAWLARSGNHLEAAQALAPLITLGEVAPDQVKDDPDFSAALQGPFFAFLPKESVEMTMRAPAESAFWGSQFDLTLSVEGGGVEPARLHLPVDGPVTPVALVEDLNASGRTIVLTVKVQGEGTISLGPVRLSVDGQRLEQERVVVTAIAPEDKETRANLPEVMPIPPSLLLDWMPELGARSVAGELWIRTSPADRVEFAEAGGDRVRYELRRDGQPEIRWYRYPGLGDVVKHVLVRRGAEVIWEGPPLASPPPGG